MNKCLIAKRFKKSLKSYNQNAKIQKRMAERLVSFLETSKFDSILEIGCGTGILTEIINQKLAFKQYTTNDIVPECEEYIKEINPEIKFAAGDIEECIKLSNMKYDLIISNASFQWIDNLKEFLNLLVNKLKPEGYILFSSFGKENFREIYHVLGKQLHYYSCSELKVLLQQYTPVIEEEIHILSFKNSKDVLKHIQLTGVNAISEENWSKKDLQNFENGYDNFCSGRITLTYNPVYVFFQNRTVG